ncbi:MAG: S8 family serine peptidase [Bacteroides sp.]|nr:S8 family serine peptidase [Bacillota bacterium]MCM1394137.1 S8 family serine peptidase [[Eubacterium] siraeum]MCM1455185.1 S8 family serine peptidase [Bacteroides sp.]
MFGKRKINAIGTFICAIILTLVLTFAFSLYDVADAVSPAKYVADVCNNDLEWWSQDDYLDIGRLKTTVQGWFSDDKYDFDYLEENPIIVAVIDSGANIEHELFSGKYGADGVYDEGAIDSNGVGLYDVILRDADGNPILKNTATNRGYSDDDIADDENRKHGTHVAGIVATLIHALDLERYIKILPIKASYHYVTSIFEGSKEKDSFDGNAVKKAVEFAIAQGADVINMSLSSDSRGFAGLDTSDAYKKAVLVAAAGNDGSKTRCYPAALPNVIGVMNYTHTGSGEIVLSDSSNYGKWSNGGYDLCAPGSDIFSANGVFSQESGYEYKSLSGTSMASPIVSFGAALLAMKYKALAGEYGEEINPEELAGLVRYAYTKTVTRNESGTQTGEYNVFDINKLVDYVSYSARIDVDDISLLNQRLGTIRSINFKLSVMPTSEYGNGDVEWFADDEKIGEGFEIEYLPPSEVKETTIQAIWKYLSPDGQVYETATSTVSVDYMPVTASTVANFDFVISDGGDAREDISVLNAGHTYRFDVSGLQNVSEADARNCVWFVNGEYVHMGAYFDFSASKEGNYEIKIKINGYESASTLVSVSSDKPDAGRKRELQIFTIVFCSVAGATALILAITIIARHRSKRKNNY